MATLRAHIEHRRRKFLTERDATVVAAPRAANTRAATPTGGLAGPARVLPAVPATDQGNSPACGGYAVANAILTRAQIDGTPIDPAHASAYGMQVYRWCVSAIDWTKYRGLSYLPAYALEHGIADTGVAVTTMDELADAIRGGNPVDISVRWWTSMSAPVDGNITVRVDDNRESFHALCVVGYDPAHDFQHMPRAIRERKIKQHRKKGKPIPAHLRPAPAPGFLLRNSWGEDWGERGCAWVTAAALADLLRRGSDETGREVNNAFTATGWAPVDAEAIYAADAARFGG